jgi:hypothetical protein
MPTARLEERRAPSAAADWRHHVANGVATYFLRTTGLSWGAFGSMPPSEASLFSALTVVFGLVHLRHNPCAVGLTATELCGRNDQLST